MNIHSANQYEDHRLINSSFEASNVDLSSNDVIIINGIFTVSNVVDICNQLKNALVVESLIEPFWFDDVYDKCNATKIFEATDILIHDRALSVYDALIILNYHLGNSYNDLFIGNYYGIQKYRESKKLQPLKLVIFTYPISNDMWPFNFTNCTVYNLKYESKAKRFNLDLDDNYESISSKLINLIVNIYSGKFNQVPLKQGNQYKVLVFMPSSDECYKVYKYISSNLMSVVGAYSYVYNGNDCIDSIVNFESLLVLSSTSNKTALDRLNIDFDVVIDTGFQSVVSEDIKSHNFIKSIERMNLTEYLARSAFCKSSNIINIQLYPESFTKVLSEKAEEGSSRRIRVKYNEEDFLCLQLSFEEWANIFKPSYHHSSMIRAGFNLALAGIVERRTEKLKIQTLFPDSGTFWNFQLSERGKQCLQLRCFSCMDSCVLIRAFEQGCAVSCLTVLCMLQSSHELFSEMYSANHARKLSNLYEGDNDLEFLLTIYRWFVKQLKEKRSILRREYKMNTKSILMGTKLRQSCKKYVEQKMGGTVHFKDADFNSVSECFILTYPLHIVKYNPDDGMYYHPQSVFDRYEPLSKMTLSSLNKEQQQYQDQQSTSTEVSNGYVLDPDSFSYKQHDSNDETHQDAMSQPPNYVWYKSIFRNSKGQLTMSCIVPICQEIFERLSS